MLIVTQVLCLAIGSAAWSLLELALPDCVPTLCTPEEPLPFAHVAARLGPAVLVPGLGLRLAAAGLGQEPPWIAPHELCRIGGGLCWTARGASIAAMLLLLWDRKARFPLAGLYGVALLVAGVALDGENLAGQSLLAAGALTAGALVLAAAALGRFVGPLASLARTLRIPDQPGRWTSEWFGPAQGTVGLAVVLAAIGRTLFTAPLPAGLLAGRWVGPAAAGMLLPAAVLMAECAGRRRAAWQYATVGLAILVATLIGWAALPYGTELAWLLRSIILLIVAVIGAPVGGLCRPAASGPGGRLARARSPDSALAGRAGFGRHGSHARARDRGVRTSMPACPWPSRSC